MAHENHLSTLPFHQLTFGYGSGKHRAPVAGFRGIPQMFDPQVLTFILLTAGIVLIFAEFFVPSGGIIAVTCVLCFIGSVFTAYKAWGQTNPAIFWSYVASLFVIVPGTVYGAFQVLLRTPLADQVFLAAPNAVDITPHQREVERLQKFIGKRGKTQSLMTPGGMVMVDGERLHALTDAIMIQPNTPIEVVGIQGTVVVVRPVSEQAVAAEELTNSTPAETSSSDDELNPFA